MEYLPSKKFLIRALTGTLILVAWFSFFQNKNTKISTNNGQIEDKNGMLVFSRTKENQESNFKNISNWNYETDGDYLTKEDENGVKIENTQSVSQTKKIVNDFTPYKITDLTISEDDNSESYKRYASNFVKAMRPYSVKELPNEGYLTMKAIEEENKDELKKIEVMSQLHKVVSDTLISMAVPSEIAEKHLNLVNNTSKISYLDSIMSKAFENPANVMEAVNQYKKETEKLVSHINDINNFFIEKGIELAPGEQINIYINLIK